MNEHRVKVDGGKYEFVEGYVISVLRHGKPYVDDLAAPNAIAAMMAELDAARLVLEWVSDFVVVETLNGRGGGLAPLRQVLARHEALVGQPMKPSPWARPLCFLVADR